MHPLPLRERVARRVATGRVRGLHPHEHSGEWREPLIRCFAPPSPARGEGKKSQPRNQITLALSCWKPR
ncbi:hypothetical protein WN72_06015 [Bradyrhizobium arachidis]|uniref:Uncharacterized protein n=1 Tax=Bradyrhizobium arachidis TaxID=858423 RepID=A0AAE7NP28_9BRAD|nr:hypothetical protein WN72_06015 [Bradyrhizobium arachidis]